MKKCIILLLLLVEIHVLWAQAPEGTINDDKLRVRSVPSTGEVLGFLNTGNVVTITSRTVTKQSIDSFNDYWYKINYGTLEGWVYGGYVDIDNSTKGKIPVDNYNGGNGSILEQGKQDDYTWIIRKHIQNDEFHCFENDITVYNTFNRTRKEVGKIQSSKRFSISQVSYIVYDNDDSQMWLKVRTDDFDGWMPFGTYDIYKDNKWTVLNLPELEGTNWTARNLTRYLSSWGNLAVQDRPGTTNSSVMFTIEQEGQNSAKIIAVTEEADGKVGRWVKIEHDDGRTGWISGDKVSLEKGGYKFNTPTDDISWSLCLP